MTMHMGGIHVNWAVIVIVVIAAFGADHIIGAKEGRVGEERGRQDVDHTFQHLNHRRHGGPPPRLWLYTPHGYGHHPLHLLPHHIASTSVRMIRMDMAAERFVK